MEYKEMIEKLGADFSEKIKAKIEEAKTAIKEERSTDLESLKNDITGMLEKKLGQDSEFVKNMQTQLDNLEGKVKDAKKAPRKSLVDILKENEDKFEMAKRGESTKFVMKDAASTFLRTKDVLVGDYAGSESFDGDRGASALEAGIANIQTRQPYLRQIANVQGTDKGLIYYTEQASVTDNAANFDEGDATAESDMAWVERKATLEEFGHHIKVSKKALDDYAEIANEIRSELIKYLELEFDRQLGFGDTTSTDAIMGLVHLASDFDASVPGLTDSVKSANNMDVIRAAIAQIYTKHFMPDYIIMHPGDAAALDLQKDDNGAYVVPPFTVSGNQIAGVRIIQNTGMDNGSFLIGQFDRMNVRINRDIEIEMFNQHSTDATKRLLTIQATMRGTMYVKENHKNAFVSGTFENGIDQLSATTSASNTTKY